MYTTSEDYILFDIDVVIPKGAEAYRNEEFLWSQAMSAIKVLAGNMPEVDKEVIYTLEGNIISAILDRDHTLYMWKSGSIELIGE